MIEIHPSAFVSPRADVEDSVKGSRIVVGARSYIGAFVKTKAVDKGGDVVIGHKCLINSEYVYRSLMGSRLEVPFPLVRFVYSYQMTKS